MRRSQNTRSDNAYTLWQRAAVSWSNQVAAAGAKWVSNPSLHASCYEASERQLRGVTWDNKTLLSPHPDIHGNSWAAVSLQPPLWLACRSRARVPSLRLLGWEKAAVVLRAPPNTHLLEGYCQCQASSSQVPKSLKSRSRAAKTIVTQILI